jgi:hypothetical protein
MAIVIQAQHPQGAIRQLDYTRFMATIAVKNRPFLRLNNAILPQVDIFSNRQYQSQPLSLLHTVDYVIAKYY